MPKPKQITVLVVEPDKQPYAKTIENSLQAQQNIVGGYIEPIDIECDRKSGRKVSFVVNEEGKLINLPTNRAMVVGETETEFLVDIIRGTFYVNAWDKEGESVGLNENEIERFTRFFTPMFFEI